MLLHRFCFTCFRESHGSPYGFFQRVRLSEKGQKDPNIIDKMTKYKHKWKKVEPIRCDLCQSEKIMAAFQCDQCVKKLCRICCRRVHSHKSTQNHLYFDLT